MSLNFDLARHVLYLRSANMLVVEPGPLLVDACVCLSVGQTVQFICSLFYIQQVHMN